MLPFTCIIIITNESFLFEIDKCSLIRKRPSFSTEIFVEQTIKNLMRLKDNDQTSHKIVFFSFFLFQIFPSISF